MSAKIPETMLLSVTSDELNVDENCRETFHEVTEAVVAAAPGA